MFHTQELQFITPTIIIYFYLNLANKYSHFKNIFFSVIVGILMLGKANYAIYLGFLSFSFLNKKFLEVKNSIQNKQNSLTSIEEKKKNLKDSA